MQEGRCGSPYHTCRSTWGLMARIWVKGGLLVIVCRKVASPTMHEEHRRVSYDTVGSPWGLIACMRVLIWSTSTTFGRVLWGFRDTRGLQATHEGCSGVY